jgi:hypothetical protein
MRTCPGCKEPQRSSAFWRGQSRCKTCQRAYVAQHKNHVKQYMETYGRKNRARIETTRRANKAEKDALIYAVKSKPCVICRRVYPPVAIDLHHVRGKKYTQLSLMRDYSMGAFKRELAKVEPVCANCHREISLPTHRTATTAWRTLSWLLDIIKAAAPCDDCGGVYPLVMLDFDHRQPTHKLFALSTARNYAIRHLSRVLQEVRKCDVVCACCHRVRTQARRTC